MRGSQLHQRDRPHEVEAFVSNLLHIAVCSVLLIYTTCMHASTTTEARGDVGAIVSDDEPGAPRRSPVRVMQDVCAWLLELGLPGMARRAFAVAEESERLAVKKAKVRAIF